MGRAKIEINGRSYAIRCGDGEEERIRQLGGYLDRVARGLLRGAGGAASVGDAHLLVMTGLTVADELAETRDRLESSAAGAAETEAEAAQAVDAMAACLEALADRLESR